MIALLLSLTVQATEIKELSSGYRLIVECEHQTAHAVAKEEWAEVARVWKKCLEEASGQGMDEVVPRLAGRHALAVIQRDYGTWKESRPVAYSEVVLATAAQGKNLYIPHEVLNANWHVIMANPQARSRLEGLHSIGIRWMPASGMDPDLEANFKEKTRRYVADLGLKVPPGDSAEVGKSDIMIMIQLGTKELTPEVSDDRGTIHVYEASLRSQAVRYKAREKRAPPVEGTSKSTGTRPNEVLLKAIDDAALEFAGDLLLQLVRVAYNSYTIPAP